MDDHQKYCISIGRWIFYVHYTCLCKHMHTFQIDIIWTDFSEAENSYAVWRWICMFLETFLYIECFITMIGPLQKVSIKSCFPRTCEYWRFAFSGRACRSAMDLDSLTGRICDRIKDGCKRRWEPSIASIRSSIDSSWIHGYETCKDPDHDGCVVLAVKSLSLLEWRRCYRKRIATHRQVYARKWSILDGHQTPWIWYI